MGLESVSASEDVIEHDQGPKYLVYPVVESVTIYCFLEKEYIIISGVSCLAQSKVRARAFSGGGSGSKGRGQRRCKQVHRPLHYAHFHSLGLRDLGGVGGAGEGLGAGVGQARQAITGEMTVRRSFRQRLLLSQS